jgi:hypothetical protein
MSKKGECHLRKCLLAVQGPLQLIAGLIALEWYGQVKHDSSESEVVLLLYDLSEVEKPLEEAIRTLSGVRSWKRIVFISEKEMSRIMKRRYSKSILELRSAIGESSFNELIIARDFFGIASPLIMNAYSDAAKIAYGDGFGFVGYEGDVVPRWSWSLKAMRIHLSAFVRRVLFGSPKRFSFDAAVLTLPIDMSGSYLRDIPLLVPQRDYALAILQECSNQLPELNSYCNRLLEGSHNPYLFLLSNLSRGGLMSIESEIDLYVKIIRETTPVGATVFLKPHPRSQIHILTSILKAIGPEYCIKAIDDSQFSRMPIELWIPLINKCRISTILSSSCVNLSYFYGNEAIISLNESNISRYFYPEWVAYVSKLNTVILESLNRLKEWDGNSPLLKAPENRL